MPARDDFSGAERAFQRFLTGSPDPQPDEPGTESEPVKEPDDGSTEAEEDEGDAA